MEQKYVLLKDLPQTKLGTEYWLNGDHYYPYKTPNGNYFSISDGKGFSVHRKWVEDNPEWFSKVKPEESKDWMITAYKYGGFIYQKSEQWGGDYFTVNGSKLSDEFKSTIHSVKRLSDGEVFTVGDVVSYKGFDGERYSDTIVEFKVMQYLKDMKYYMNTMFKDGGCEFLSKVQKKSTPKENKEDVFQWTTELVKQYEKGAVLKQWETPEAFIQFKLKLQQSKQPIKDNIGNDDKSGWITVTVDAYVTQIRKAFEFGRQRNQTFEDYMKGNYPKQSNG